MYTRARVRYHTFEKCRSETFNRIDGNYDWPSEGGGGGVLRRSSLKTYPNTTDTYSFFGRAQSGFW